MRVRAHRGSHEIGGNCVEVAASGGGTVILDLGRPLSAGWDDPVPLPPVPGLGGPGRAPLAVLISHPHLDHYGLLAEAPSDVPVYIGREAASVLEAASFFSPVSGRIAAVGHYEHRRAFRLGPFEVTPFLNDHSAFDAYSLLIEADGRRLFYTGDIRGHGRKAALFDELLVRPPARVDALLMEGTHVRLDDSHDNARFPTESELEDRFVELCRTTPGAVAVAGSAQNMDRLVTLYRAARRSGRQLVVDLYAATVATAARASIPQPGFPDLRVFLPWRQRVKVKESAEFWRAHQVRPVRVFPQEMAENPGRFLLHTPSSAVRELVTAGAVGAEGAVAWSMWAGYLRAPSGAALTRFLDERGIPLMHVHTSGHASVTDLRRLVTAMSPGKVVPIHSEAGDRFTQLFPGVERQADGAWWEV